MVKLNVAIDGRALVGHRTGIGVHTAEIASRLEVTPPPLIATHACIEDRSGIERCRFSVDPALNGIAWQQFRFATVAESARCGVVWGPHGTLPVRLRIPAVVTIHDLTALTTPLQHRLRTVLSFGTFVSRSLFAAKRIAAVSNTAANDVIRWFGIPASRIEIIPNGVDPFFQPRVTEVADDDTLTGLGLSGRPYLFYAGTLEPRKGIGDLLDAWQQLTRPRPALVISGDAGWGEQKLRRRLDAIEGHGELVRTGWVDREVLRTLYRNAIAFVYPSHFEGFGLPVLEAMSCGTPVVTTDGGALAETAGDAALIVGAGRPVDLHRALERLLTSATLRETLISRGLDRASQFRWERSASLMTELLAAAAGSRG